MGIFNRRAGRAACIVAAVAVSGACVFAAEEMAKRYKVHDMSRPKPEVVTPGQFATADKPSVPPSDAIVLLGNGEEDLKKNWDGGAWTFEGGAYIPAGKSITTKEQFGDCQLHVEWAEPTPAKGDSQGRGNSGVIFLGRYELQVLDSYKNDTYPDGQCGAIYSEYPPLVNVCRPPGEFQTYDVVFRAPQFDSDHKVTSPGTFTVFQNGVLVQDHVELIGSTSPHVAKFEYFEPKGHLELQFHGNKVRYRQVWIRPLGPQTPKVNPAEG